MNRSAFRFPQPTDTLKFDGERYVTGLLGDISSGDIQSEHYHRYLFALRFCQGKDVVDIACGEGYGSSCLGQVANSVIGIDANQAAVDFANRNYLSERVSFKVGRAQTMPIMDASLDVVVSFETLEHFKEHEAFMAEIRRVLRPGGLLVISSPNRAVYTEESSYHNEWHLRELDRGEFIQYLAGAFANVRLFAQRPLAGSVIADDTDQITGRPEGFILRGDGVFHRTDGVPHPPFFVALASDAALPAAASSILQNPALLTHIENQRRLATQQAADSATLTAAAEQRAAAATEEAERAQRLVAAAETEAKAMKVAQEQLRRELEETKTRVEEAKARVEEARSASASLAARSSQRVETLRQEITAVRRRNEELAAESIALRTGLDQASAERDYYAWHFGAISQSTAWRVTWPARQIAAKFSPAARRAIRATLQSTWRLTTLDRGRRRAQPDQGQILAVAGPPSAPRQDPPAQQPLQVEEPSPPLPSELRRQQDPDWVEPNERVEFIRLRNHRSKAKIAVVAHVFYAELWPEMAAAIGNVPETFDLFVTLVTGASDQLAPAILQRFPAAHVLFVDNHGRDIYPFLALIRTGALFGYELICKLHSKRSAYREGGDEWRKHLIGGILGSAAKVRTIVNAFRSDPDLGIVVADASLFGGREYWISNEQRSLQLFRAIGLNANAFEQQFVGGSMFWIRPLLLRAINVLDLGYDDFEPEPLAEDGFTAHAVERLVSIVCYDAGMRAEESGRLDALPRTTAAQAISSPKVHLIANYLPQYHPIQENDEWWGRGFTEWSNVTKAKPLFQGHRQPRLPTDLGFYDLRLPETRIAQADLARRHGITAFSYYYYWFNGRRLLNRPIDEVVASGQPDFPFMLCWANEPWTRNWDGLSKEILLPQDYAPGWERAFAADVAPIMRDPRYLRLDGAPMLALYRVAQFPDRIGSIQRLRVAFEELGLPDIHLIGGWVQIGDDGMLPPVAGDLGLDAYFEFPPHGIPHRTLEIPAGERMAGYAANVYDYGATVEAVLDQLASEHAGFRYRGVMMGWDNTARRGNRSFVFHGATPVNFRRWLRAALHTARSEARGPETALFINAWNEWAEGTYLEPDRDFGTGWLEAVASATADATVEQVPALPEISD